MFNLLSYFSLNQTIISSFASDVQKLIKMYQVGFFVVNSAVVFMNVRFQGNSVLFICLTRLDDYKYTPNQKAIWFAPTKLESKVFNLTNVDIK